MWTRSFSRTYQNISKEQIWAVWSDISVRHLWDLDTEWAKMANPEDKFKKGSEFYMKPKGGPKLKLFISEARPHRLFTDSWIIPFTFTRLDGIHQIETTKEGLLITTTIQIKGPLGWALKKLVGEKIVQELPGQTEALVQYARTLHV